MTGTAEAWVERRGLPRVQIAYPATVRGIDANGEAFEISTLIDNLGAGGLFVYLPRPISKGVQLFAVVRLATALGDAVPVPRIATRGVVVRTEPAQDGGCGVALAFTQHRFLYD